jgi:hypothetical protein
VKAALAIPEDAAVADVVARLRAHVDTAQSRLRPQPFGLLPALAQLLGEPGLKPGAVYSLDAEGALLQALLAGPSLQGHWCGVVGMPSFAVEAAALTGIRLDRLVLVPEPGDQWLAVTAALAEVVPVLAVHPSGRVREADAARLGSRLRDRGGVLLVTGTWPRAEARLTLGERHWHGLGSGDGHLTSRDIQVQVASRRYPSGRRGWLRLPDPDGRVVAGEPLRPGLQVVG